MMASTFYNHILTRLMRVFFYLLYNSMAWSYDIVAALVSGGRWQDWVMTVLPYLNGPRVLEIGHGPGHLQIALQEKGVRVFGIDASRYMGQQARRRILKREISPHLISGYAKHLPFPDRCFNQIVATFPTEFINSNEALREAHRLLLPGGSFVVLPVAWITGEKLIDRNLSSLFRFTGQSPDWDPEWLTPFDKAGFTPIFELITQKSWSLIIIHAHKPDS